jgi:hypothetical protein
VKSHLYALRELFRQRRWLKKLRSKGDFVPPNNQALLIAGEGVDAPLIAYLCPAPDPATRRLVVVRAVMFDFRVIRVSVIDARDCMSQILLTDGWKIGGDIRSKILPPSHLYSQIAPSLDHLVESIAPKGGWNG